MMYPYRYLKAPPPRPRNKASWIISLLLMGTGSLIVFWVVWPILSFRLVEGDLFSSITSPVAEGNVVNPPKPSFLSPIALAAGTVQTTTSLSGDTNPNSWFPTSPQKQVVTPVNTYNLSIPKLKINNAVVTVGGDDLNHSLVHYGGTALPGQYGTAVIFGHSELPQFYSPTNYLSIFSLLPTLKSGDDIYVTYDSVQYHYVIEQLIVTDPTDLTPLAQRFDDSYLTLITCVPPGTTWERLNVRARIVKE